MSNNNDNTVLPIVNWLIDQQKKTKKSKREAEGDRISIVFIV